MPECGPLVLNMWGGDGPPGGDHARQDAKGCFLQLSILDAVHWVCPLAAASAAFTILLITGLIPFSRKLGLVDHPGGRKHHGTPTPVIGGIAIALGVGGSIAWYYAVDMHSSFPFGLALGAVLLLFIGVLDDLLDLAWYYRLSGQALAAICLVWIDGTKLELIGPVFGLAPLTLGEFSPVITVLATIGVINALNMADGIDGLAGMLVTCALGMLAAASIYAGNMTLASVLVIIMASVAGFLLFNMRSPWRARASTFLGNSGSEFLGLLIVWATFKLTQNYAHPVSPILAPFLIAPPIIDCLTLLARRVVNGKSPFSADRTHMHHLLMEAGFTVSGAVTVMAVASLTIGGAAAIALRGDVPQPILLIIFIMMFLAYLTFTLDWPRAVRVVSRLRER